jgi:hypothetical protein
MRGRKNNMKRCFVISPIDREGSEIRNHADDVFEYIIEPALKNCGIKPFRSDHLHKYGLISDQTFDAILNYDLCIAVLTYKNPNVFYELAIAHFANRPVIVLIEKNEEIPFDVKDMRCVKYDLSIRSYNERKYIDQIVEYIKNLEASNWKVKSILPEFCINTSGDSGNREYFEKRSNYGAEKSWEDILLSAKDCIYLAGLNLNNWKRIPKFEQIILEKARIGCKVRFLINDAKNPAFRELIDSDAVPGQDSFNVLSALSNTNYEFYSNIANQTENVEIRKILRGNLTHFMSLNDKYVIYNPYFFSIKSTHGPLWVFNQNSNFYSILKKEFETLWDANS